MDPILSLPEGLPPHDAAPLAVVPHTVVATWPVGTFLENLAVLDDGGIAVSVLSGARVDRVTPGGEVKTLAQFAAPPTGLCVLDRVLFAAVGEPGVPPMTLWRIDPLTGAAELCMAIDGAVFLNGLARFDAGRMIATDSAQGRLYLIDPSAKTSSVWLEDERLTPAPGIGILPGANGVKRFGDAIHVSSTGRALFLRAPIEPGGAAGGLKLLVERTRIDDFAFDARGAAYLTTHIGHSLDRLDPGGSRVSLGGPAQGLAGSTACAFGRSPADARQIYVTTTGGIVTPVDGVVQPARLVRLDVGAFGWTPEDPTD